MKKRKNNGFFKKQIDAAFNYITKFFFIIVNFFASKSGEVAFQVSEIRAKSKDLVGTNLQLAEEHLKNNNFFDAKLRYKIVLRMEKTNFEALFGLGYIALLEKKLEKAEEYFNKALQYAPNEQEKNGVLSSIEKVSLLKSAPKT
jgi:Tfp pilus assembly protein PilF